jgi:hypothetical protein
LATNKRWSEKFFPFINSFRKSLWYNPAGKNGTEYKYNGNFNNFTDAEIGKKYKKYRLEDGSDKIFEYIVIWKIQRLSIDSKSSFRIAGRDYSVDYHKEEEKRDYSYGGHLENPYIRARTAKMLSPNGWVGQQSKLYEDKVSEKLSEIWIAHTCKRAPEESNKFKQADLSMRCSLARDSRYQDIVDSWYGKNFFVSESQAKFVLNL